MKKIDEFNESRYRMVQITGKIGFVNSLAQRHLMENDFGINSSAERTIWRYDDADEPHTEDVDNKKRGGIISIAAHSISAKATGENAVEQDLDLDPCIEKLKINVRQLTQLSETHFKGIINKIIKRKRVFGASIGNFVPGRYKSTSGDVFDEGALCVELINIDDENLYKFAVGICEEFNRQCVLIKNYTDGNIYFLGKE